MPNVAEDRTTTTVWDRARRAFGDGEGAYVALGVCAVTSSWEVKVALAPDLDREGQIVVDISGDNADQAHTTGSDGVTFHCPADELEELGRAILEAARGLRELTGVENARPGGHS